MHIACPVDPGLPRLSAALDDQYLAGLVGARLDALGQAGLRLESVRPGYIRYKPGTSAWVQVQVRLGTASGEVLTQDLTFALFPGEQAAAMAARPSSRRRAAKLPAGPWPLAGVWVEDSLGALVQGFPFDRGLPGLAWALQGPKLSRLITEATGESWPEGPPPERLRHKAGRRAVLRAEAYDGRCCFVKLGPELRPDLLAALAPALQRRGLRVPRVLAAAGAKELVVLEGLAGDGLAPPPSGRTADPRAGTVLADRILRPLRRAQGLALEGAGLPGLRVWAPQPVLERAVQGLGAILPAELPGLLRLAALVEEAWLRLPPQSPVLVHGDFYEDQILLHPVEGTAYLDWDEAALGPASLDAACWLAHARAAALEEEPAPVAAEAIQEAWLGLRPTEARPLALLAGLQGLALGVGPFRRLEPDWPAAVRRRLRQAEADIRSAQAVTFAPARRLPVQSTPLLEG